jgi:hypothetical protein
MSANEKVLMIASLATVAALLTRRKDLQLLAALTGALFAVLNARELMARIVP